MARRRYLYSDAVSDKYINKLSIEARDIWWRLLSSADDCGVMPADPEELARIICCPSDLKENLGALLIELSEHLGYLFEFRGKQWFCFKPESWDYYQGHLLSRRTKSEYLRIRVKEFQRISENFRETQGNSQNFRRDIESIGTGSGTAKGTGSGTATEKAEREIPRTSVKGFQAISEAIKALPGISEVK